jgi:hypothetical protein
MWSEFVWLKIGSLEGSYEHNTWTFGFHGFQKIVLTKRLLASQEELWSITCVAFVFEWKNRGWPLYN